MILKACFGVFRSSTPCAVLSLYLAGGQSNLTGESYTYPHLREKAPCDDDSLGPERFHGHLRWLFDERILGLPCQSAVVQTQI